MVRPTTKRSPSLLNRLARAVKLQKQTPLSTPLSHRLTALRYGFRSSRYTLYDFGKNDPRDYLPDTVFREATAINGDFCRRVLEDKLLFTHFMQDVKLPGFRVPEVFALVGCGQLCLLSGHGTLSNLLAAYGGVILKPVAGWQGAGILNVSSQGGKLVVNGQPSSLSALENQLATLDGYLVTERIVQDGYAHDIFPGSVNSIRVTTMQDPDDHHRPFTAVAVHRFGSRTTGPTDNVHRGGLMAQIDLGTGRLGPAIKFPHETGGERRWCSRHPDTGAPIEGVRVPGWSTLQARLLEFVSTAPSFPLRRLGPRFNPRYGCWLVEGKPQPLARRTGVSPLLERP